MVEDSRKLFVAGLPDTISEDVLRQLFEATGGNVVEVTLPRDRATGRPRGFGFVTLSTAQEASAARESLDGSFHAGKSISVRPWQADPPKREPGQAGGPRSSGPREGGGGGGGGPAPDRTLYVGNLPYDATQEEVEALVNGAGAGNVVRVHLPMDAEGRKRGFGFVTMASAEAARGAIEGLRGADIRGRRLVVNLAHPKGEKPAGGGYEGGAPSSFRRDFSPPPGGPPPSGGRGRGGYDERRRFDGDGPPRGPGGGTPGGGGRRANNKDWRHQDDDDD